MQYTNEMRLLCIPSICHALNVVLPLHCHQKDVYVHRCIIKAQHVNLTHCATYCVCAKLSCCPVFILLFNTLHLFCTFYTWCSSLYCIPVLPLKELQLISSHCLHGTIQIYLTWLDLTLCSFQMKANMPLKLCAPVKAKTTSSEILAWGESIRSCSCWLLWTDVFYKSNRQRVRNKKGRGLRGSVKLCMSVHCCKIFAVLQGSS